MICSAICSELAWPSDPSRTRAAGLTAERRRKERGTQSRVAEQEKSSDQTQLAVASTDAFALRTIPFALNECLRLTTLLLSTVGKKKKSPEAGVQKKKKRKEILV